MPSSRGAEEASLAPAQSVTSAAQPSGLEHVSSLIIETSDKTSTETPASPPTIPAPIPEQNAPSAAVPSPKSPQEVSLAPLPTTFDPDAEIQPPSSAGTQIAFERFTDGEEQEDDLCSVPQSPLVEQEGDAGEGGEMEDPEKMMEYITSLQQFGVDGDEEVEEEEEEEVEQIEVREGSTDGKEVQDKGDEIQANDNKGQGEVTKEPAESTAPSSPLTPISDLPELPDEFDISKPTTDPEAESSAAAIRRSTRSPSPSIPTITPTLISEMTSTKRARGGSTIVTSTKRKATKGKGKALDGDDDDDDEIIILGDDDDDLCSLSLSDKEELKEIKITIKPDEEELFINGNGTGNGDSDGESKRASKRLKGLDGRPLRGVVRKRLEASLSAIKPEKTSEKITPRVKAMSDAMIKKELAGKTREVQMGPCLRPRYAKWGKCTQCIAKIGGDSCRFRDFRMFPIDPATTDIIGPGMFESKEWKEEMTPLPRNFNVALEEKHIAHTEKLAAPMLLPLITEEARHIISKKAIKRGVDTAKHRSVCDFCASTIFGGWFFCTRCGRDYCLHCERYFPDSLETITQSPWPLDDASRPRLLRCSHQSIPGEPTPKGPAFHTRHNLQPASRFSDEEVKDHWLSLAEFVLNIKNEEKLGTEEKLRLMGFNEDEEVQKLIDNWKAKSTAVDVNLEVTIDPVLVNEEPSMEMEKTNMMEDYAARYKYTKSTHPTAIPIPDPAGLESHSREFMFINNDQLDNDLFDHMWSKGEPIVVDGVEKGLKLSWTPDTFIHRFGKEECVIVDCQTNVSSLHTVEKFFEKFKNSTGRDKSVLKLKDWPATDDLRKTHPGLYNDFCDALPVPDYTRREGVMNLYAHFPPGPTRPDIGPKMYNAFEAVETKGGFGSTRLHMDVADAVNVMLYASPRSRSQQSSSSNPDPETNESGTDTGTEEKEPEPELEPGCAVWDLFRAEDADSLRKFLLEKFDKTHIFTDPIHSQLFYLDSELRKELFEKYGVVSWRVYQYPGQAVFIPAGCAHQVCNLADCIKIALDFVSPHNVHRCKRLTQDFRKENFIKAWKDDVLQLYNVLWFSWLSCRETRERHLQQEKENESIQAARQARLANLRLGHDANGGNVNSLAGRLGSPRDVNINTMNTTLASWTNVNISSVRDEPMTMTMTLNGGSRSPSVMSMSMSRGGSPTIARVMAESQSQVSSPRLIDLEREDHIDNSNTVDRVDSSTDEKLGDKDENEGKGKDNGNRELAEKLLELTLKKQSMKPEEEGIFLTSSALNQRFRRTILPSSSSTTTTTTSSSTSMMKVREKSEKVKIKEEKEKERKRKTKTRLNPPRALRTATLIKLGAKKMEDVLQEARNDMGSIGIGHTSTYEIDGRPSLHLGLEGIFNSNSKTNSTFGPTSITTTTPSSEQEQEIISITTPSRNIDVDGIGNEQVTLNDPAAPTATNTETEMMHQDQPIAIDNNDNNNNNDDDNDNDNNDYVGMEMEMDIDPEEERVTREIAKQLGLQASIEQDQDLDQEE